MKMAISILLAVVLALSLAACSGDSNKPSSSDTPSALVNTGIVIEYDENILMNIYDIRISVDDSLLGTQVQGEKKLYELNLTEGNHKIVFAEVGDESNTTNQSFTVSEGNYYYFFIKTRNSGIVIEKRDTLTLDEVQVFKDIADDADESDTPTEEISPTIISQSGNSELIASFSEEHAMRAAVVAFTNCFADDVFTEDGNDYDVSKFHSYADISGFFMHVVSKGDWNVKNENIWHVEHLELQLNGYNTTVDASLDVSCDGENYIISNLTGKAPSYDDSNASYPDMRELEENVYASLYFVVPFKLIKDDRIDTLDALEEKNFDLYFDAMDGLITVSGGVIIEFQTLKKDDYSVIHVIVSDEWYKSEEYEKERFVEIAAENVDIISDETGVAPFVSVYFYDAYGKKVAEPKLLGGYKILR